MLKKLAITTAMTSTTLALNSCALVTAPVKVAGKVATTSIGVTGKVAGAGLNALTPNNKETPQTEED